MPIGALGCFLTGAVVLLIAESDLVRLAAALLLLAAMFLGVVAVATPELLSREDDQDS
jgi:hypothetical protein